MIANYYKNGIVLFKKKTKHQYKKYIYYKARKKNKDGITAKNPIKRKDYDRLTDKYKDKFIKTLYFKDK